MDVIGFYSGEVDGILEKNTRRTTYIQYFQPGGQLKGAFTAGQSAGTQECAFWQNKLLRENDYNISGNAWDLNGVDVIFDGYKGLNIPTTYNRRQIMDLNRQATQNVYKNFNSKTLDPNQVYVVNMFYSKTPHQQDAFSAHNGRKGAYGTHTGILTNSNGRWYVTHNIGNRVYTDDFIRLQNSRGGYGVTTIYKPRKNNIFTRTYNYLASLFR